ncbi:heptaprenyl diphosphate synthase component 1 [Staphylococcus chromogenes]|uniref:heptaprenyl diphosphate synthase component 1 n=1 Tax=Staphylococcus chromogenes TaxID=46126 RepID=UPI000D1BBDED|nr:heptaprenyl diphosphate synthase component 1 [Staphylococcus chromogenes]PTG00876.1 hypothetical protein BU663_02830 [Staphylococcus chromogenes]
MSKTFELLEKQMNKTLIHIHKPKNVFVNRALSEILDSLEIPTLSKVAVLSINTAMNHLDRISFYRFERDAILIGDLYSAHYYYLISQIQSTTLQKHMSEAIIKINAQKSYLQNENQSLSQHQLLETVLAVEFGLIDTLLNIYQLNTLKEENHQRIIAHLAVDQLTYLNFLNETQINQLIDVIHSKYKYTGVGFNE